MAKMRGFLGITARALMLLAAFLLFMSYASMVVNPSKAWFMTVIGLLFVPIVLLNLILLVWAIRRKSSAFLIPLLALIPSAILVGRYFQFSSGAAERQDGSVKIVSYNVGRFQLGKDSQSKEGAWRKACVDSVVRFIEETKADIVCLQEVDLNGEYDIRRFFQEHLPEYDAGYFMFINKEGAYGNVTLSRFPIVDKGRLEFEKSSNLAIYTDLKVATGSTLRVYNCHFESYNISLTNLVKSWSRDSTLVKDTEKKMKRSIAKRPLQVDQVMSDIEDCPLESIVAGDFNDNPMSYTYHRLMKGRKDTFVEAGKGFGATYSSLWPLIRIDYVLYPKHFEAVSHHTPRLPFSDHYPVVAEINF
ncbi:MAG: endonuclease/exonuclease/phosphatase family protein [Bacteroidales bacterium]|nr:endonuclease/exonuclease/phosphatase family protein [Bacteroidales bacterium]